MAGFCIQTVRLFSVLGVIFCLTLSVSCSREQSTTSQAPSSTSQTAAPAPAAPAVPSSTAAQATPAPSGAPVSAGSTQINLGMTSEQVRQILGNPTRVEQEGQKVEWKYYTPQGKLEVEFYADKVASIETK